MAKITINVSSPVMLGLGSGALRLKPGKNVIDDSYLDKWYVKAMLESGTISIMTTPKPILIDESKLAEVSIGPNSMNVVGSAAAEEIKTGYTNPLSRFPYKPETPGTPGDTNPLSRLPNSTEPVKVVVGESENKKVSKLNRAK